MDSNTVNLAVFKEKIHIIVLAVAEAEAGLAIIVHVDL